MRSVAKLVVLLVLAALASGTAAAQSGCRAPDRRTAMPNGPVPLVLEDGAGREKQIYSRSVALLIGESHYAGKPAGLKLLPAIPDQLNAIGAVLEAQGFEVWTFMDLDSTQLQPTLDCFFRRDLPRDPQMRFLLWYAGHGETLLENSTEPRQGYVLPTDINLPVNGGVSAEEIRGKGLRYSQFIDWARNAIEAKHALMIFDSCFSGSLLDAPNRSAPVDLAAKPRPPAYALSDDSQLPMREFLTSGTASQTVPDFSLFAKYFAEALRGERPEANGDGDNVLLGEELILFLKQYVSLSNPLQTPTSGRLQENVGGQIIFALPPRPLFNGVPVALASPADAGGMRPVYQGAVDPTRGGANIVQFFEADGYLTTARTDCDSECPERGLSKRYALKVPMPSDAPAGALMDTPELRCISGPCQQGGRVVAGPLLEPDRRAMSVSLDAWGAPSVWRLAARLILPATAAAPSTRVVVDRSSGAVRQVDERAVTIAANAQPRIQDAALLQLLERMQGDDTSARRAARVALAHAIEGGSPELVAQLIRRAPVGTYRYQLGLAEALAMAQGGWLAAEASSRTLLEQLMKRPHQDGTLAASLARALQNQRLFAYYETGADGWLTPAGQLRRRNERRPALAAFERLAPGDVLIAASEVNLRAGLGTTSSIVAVAASGDCLKLVAPERDYRPGTANGGWLQVVRLRACGVGG